MSCDNNTVNYVFNNDYVFNNYRELTTTLRELKEEKLIGEETSLTCCTSVAPCSVGEGGCTSDSYCSGDLVCGSGNCDISLGFTAGALFYIQVQQFYTFSYIFGNDIFNH